MRLLLPEFPRVHLSVPSHCLLFLFPDTGGKAWIDSPVMISSRDRAKSDGGQGGEGKCGKS